jgi:putative hemolysin
MLFPALILFFLFLVLSAFFSSSETAFIAASPIKINYLAKKGSKKAVLVKKMLKRIDRLLATILVGNTLVNIAAASVATFIFLSFMPEKKNQAVFLATVVTTLLILVFSEISPKTYATYNTVKLSFLFAPLIRFFIIVFYPMVKFFTFLTRLIFPSSMKKGKKPGVLDEEEVKVLVAMGVKGMSSRRKKMISGVLDIGSRPIREIMIPRPKIRAIELSFSLEQMLEVIQSTGFSRFPVIKDRLDNIMGVVHAKDIIPYLIDKKEYNINMLLRKPFFVPESASLENVMSQMQSSANHMVFVVDEFGNMEGIVTLEDILEELVGEIQDEYDVIAEDLIVKKSEYVYVLKGSAPIKDINQRMPLTLPEKSEYTTVAGFFLNEFGKIPREQDELDYQGHKFKVEKMNKHQIERLQVVLCKERE